MSSSSKRPYPDDDSDASHPRTPVPPGCAREISKSSFGAAPLINQGTISNSTVFIQAQPPNEAPGPDTAELQAAERRQRLLESLDFPRIDARKTAIRTAQRRTCQWLTNHAKYREWLDPNTRGRNHGFLWMRGKAGAGKSTMMKHIYLKAKKSDRAGSLTASFFFNARGAPLEKSIAGMYRSLLSQLFKKFPDLKTVLDDTEHIPQNQQVCPGIEGLKHLFRLAALGLGQRILACFIDALDECDEEEVRGMVRFFEELAEEVHEEHIQLRICFSSRPYPTITVRHGILFTLEDEEGHAQDLEKYVDSNLRIDEPSLLQEMKSRIMEKAGRIFLWVVLVVDILNKEEDAGGLALRKKLSAIPPELGKLFKSIILRDDESPDRLKLCVLWILCAERPLTPGEFRHALWVSLLSHQSGSGQLEQETSVDIEVPDASNQKACEKLVTSSSKGLAEIANNDTQPTVQFIHESVRDFLVKEKGLHDLWPELGHEWEAKAHETLKLSCDSYLRLSRFRETMAEWENDVELPDHRIVRDGLLGEYPFLNYACEYILHHANYSAAKIPQSDFSLHFFDAGANQILNFSERRRIARYGQHATPLYILADRGLANLVRLFVKTHSQYVLAYSQGERFGYPLFAAMAHGHRDTAAALLGLSPAACEEAGILEGIKYKKDMDGCKGFTLLSWAAAHGNLKMAKALIQQGAYASIDEVDKSRYTALHRASMTGHGPVVEHLIKSDANIDAKIAFKRAQTTPLMLAAGFGHLHVVQILLASGANHNASDNFSWTALMYAADSGNEEIICLLLDNAPLDVNRSDVAGNAALHLAAINGHVSAVRTLLTRGAHFHTRNKQNQTSFMCASIGGHEGVVRLLLDDATLDVNAADVEGNTPLHLAAINGHVSIIDILLTHGAHLHTRNKLSQTSLMCASNRGHEGVVHSLLVNGADVDASDAQGHTSLLYAVRNGQAAAVRVLLDNKANIHPFGGDMSILKDPAMLGDEVLVRLLVQHGARVHSDSSPLVVACAYGHEAIVRILLAHGGANLSSSGGLSLTYAAKGGHLEVVRLLLANGADGNGRPGSNENPLFAACRAGHTAVVEALLEHGASIVWQAFGEVDFSPRDAQPAICRLLTAQAMRHDTRALEAVNADGRTLLMLVSQAGTVEAVRALLERKADVNCRDPQGATALMLACEGMHVGAAKVLIDGGANVDAADKDGNTALAVARRGNENGDMVRLLIKAGANAEGRQ